MTLIPNTVIIWGSGEEMDFGGTLSHPAHVPQSCLMHLQEPLIILFLASNPTCLHTLKLRGAGSWLVSPVVRGKLQRVESGGSLVECCQELTAKVGLHETELIPIYSWFFPFLSSL